MTTSSLRKHHGKVSQDSEPEEEEDLFEIDLEAVNCVSPPRFWESCCYTSTENVALLANCLLPKSDVSSAVPAVCSSAGNTNVVLIAEPTSLGEYLRLPFLGIIHQKMEPKFHFQFQR
ncbi:uncharacterized protein LOC114192610 [Vigna unguiculata]|uniref:Uncharacterized protein n=1 Tax=Vigna unguiculata TaxID=3917 RepID=A0A4D6MWM1_VIGUN|nr:uncharacterized protein LOC114192610 [Vigna unguiculata]QCE05833.1 hypothetical protein DEO72_LG9g841 [Vigna unguiculata]